MDYQELWFELKRWVDGGEGVCAEEIKNTTAIEQKNLLNERQKVFSLIHGKMEHMEKYGIIDPPDPK